MGIRFNWVAKHTLFKGVLGMFFRSIGGIAVDRSSGTQFMMKVIDLFEERDKLILAIAPEGTRSRTRYWKTGFYKIAEKASVPIVLGYIDYPEKRVGLGKIMTPTGDLPSDFEIISEFYHGMRGKIVANQGEVKIKRPKRK